MQSKRQEHTRTNTLRAREAQIRSRSISPSNSSLSLSTISLSSLLSSLSSLFPQSLLDRFARSICGIRRDGRGSQWGPSPALEGVEGQKEGQRWVGGRAGRENGGPGSSSAQSPQKPTEKKPRSTWNLNVETDHSPIWDLSLLYWRNES